jgi:predicted nuclease of predicted toxin-antitoxin system
VSLRIFSDHCVPAEITGRLRAAGHRVTELREALPVNSPDPLVLAKARELDAILLSLNGDFADIVGYPPARHGGVIGLQLHNHPEIIPQLMTRLLAFLAEHPVQDFYPGKLLLVEVHRIRIRE